MPHRTRRLTWLPAGALVLLLATGFIGPVAAQEVTLTLTIAVTRVTATPIPTATLTRTPTIAPSPTPTLTAFETRLALAHAYLAGSDTAKAIGIYSALAAQTIEETLVRWNAAVAPDLVTPVHTRPLERAGLSWPGALWAQVSRPPRMYLVTGLLLGDQPGPYRLSVERLDLRTNSVGAAHTFESRRESPEPAFREMAEAAAYWLRDPRGLEQTPALLSDFDAIRDASAAVVLLIPVRQQVNAESVDYSTAPRALDAAQALVNQLPAGSSLRADLQATVDDLRSKVQPGRV